MLSSFHVGFEIVLMFMLQTCDSKSTCTGLQVSLGIATLMLHVPVPLAAVHQGGSLALLSFALWFAHALRPLPITAAAAVASRVVTAQRAKTAADVARKAL